MSATWQWAKANPDAAARQIRELERANAYLHDTLDAVIAADERAVDLWRAAHPVNELVIPDRGRLVGWLLEQNAALRADKDRLDWLTDTGCWLTFPGFSKRQNWKQGTARDVIDAARKEAQP